MRCPRCDSATEATVVRVRGDDHLEADQRGVRTLMIASGRRCVAYRCGSCSMLIIDENLSGLRRWANTLRRTAAAWRK